MAITIRLMSWNVETYGENFYEYALGEIIAILMRTYAIDICVLMEVMKKRQAAVLTDIRAALLGGGYGTNWHTQFVDVGDQGVAYIWHEEPLGANSFVGQRYTNSTEICSGAVWKNQAGATIAFPKTKTAWDSVPTVTTDGRRPGYAVFATNDGGAARLFSFLDMHCPDDQANYIQAYSAYLYASSREIQRFEPFDAIAAATSARTPAVTQMAGGVNASITAAFSGTPPAELIPFADEVANAALERLLRRRPLATARPSLVIGSLLADCLAVAAKEAGAKAFKLLSPHLTGTTSHAACAHLVEAAAVASTMAAFYMVASVALPSVPVLGSPIAAAAEANMRVQAELLAHPVSLPPPGRPNVTKVRTLVRNAITQTVAAVTQHLTFPALPTTPLDAAIMAGDFNLQYPDTTVYLPMMMAKMGGGNAFTALLAAAHPNTPPIAARTTAKSASAFKKNRIYRLWSPIRTTTTYPPIGGLVHVPIDLAPMANIDYLGVDEWLDALKARAALQSFAWAPLWRDYEGAIRAAFEATAVLNDTNAYYASRYDNFFVRGATQGTAGRIDVLSELGSWAADTSILNRWDVARGRLNATAQNEVNRLILAIGGLPPYPMRKGETVVNLDPDLRDAEQAAAFNIVLVANHLPIFVEIQV
jgi:hypothetical protein